MARGHEIKTVFIIEDEVDIWDSASRVLEMEDCCLLQAEDGDDTALAVLAQRDKALSMGATSYLVGPQGVVGLEKAVAGALRWKR